MERGTVSMRVAFVLRSAEVQPLFRDLCEVCKKKKQFFSFITEPSSPPLSWNYPLFMSRPKPVSVIGNRWSQTSMDAVCTEHKPCSCARHRPSFGKRTSGFFWKTLPTSHNNQPILFSLFDEEEEAWFSWWWWWWWEEDQDNVRGVCTKILRVFKF